MIIMVGVVSTSNRLQFLLNVNCLNIPVRNQSTFTSSDKTVTLRKNIYRVLEFEIDLYLAPSNIN